MSDRLVQISDERMKEFIDRLELYAQEILKYVHELRMTLPIGMRHDPPTKAQE